MPKRRSSGRRRRPLLDWVQNIESYHNTTLTYNVGLSGRFAVPLIYSAAMLQQWTGQDPTVDLQQGQYAIPNTTKGIRVRAIHWWARVEPSAWSLGSQMRSGLRIMPAPMELDDGSQLLRLNYTMWAGSPSGAVLPQNQAAAFADDRFYTEQRLSKTFGDASTTPELVHRGRWSGNKKLNPEDGLFAYFEAPTGAVNMRMSHIYFRTLVELQR